MAFSKRPSSRKSIAYLPSPEDIDPAIADKENLTVAGFENVHEAPQRKTRSKSLGPGGLDALKEGAGNKRKVI